MHQACLTPEFMNWLLPATVRRQFDLAHERRLALAAAPDSRWPELQLDAISETWPDCVVDVPYYSDLVASGSAPKTIRHWDDVRAIPVLTRQIIQDRPEAFIRRSRPPRDYAKTGGSSGTPLRLGMEPAERQRMRLVKLAAWQDLGYASSSRLFIIWGHSHLLGTGWRGRAHHLKRRIKDAMLGYRRVDAHRLTRDSCRQFAEELIRFRPSGVIGYAAALDLFAQYTQEFRQRFRWLGMRFVLLTAEVPPRPDTLQALEDLFGCPIVQEYGGAEFGQVAFKTGAEPFKVYSDLNYVEAEPVDPANAQLRSLLVTSLYPRYVPLVRYRVGDGIAGAEISAHGHVTQFQAVAGRLNDMIFLGQGDAIHSVAVFHAVYQERIYNIQLELRDSGIELSLVSPEPDRAAMEARVRGRLAQVHPLLGGVRFKYVEDLEANRSGKRRWFVDHRSGP